MEPPTSDEGLVAMHEAGHAVIAYIGRVALTEVSIIPDDERDSAGHVSPRPYRDFHPNYDSSAITTRRLESLVMVKFGGLVLEGIVLGEPCWDQADEDYRSACGLASHQVGSSEQWGAYIDWLWARTEGLLRQPWHMAAVEKLTAALLERKRLGGRQAKRIVRDAVEQWHQDSGAGRERPPVPAGSPDDKHRDAPPANQQEEGMGKKLTAQELTAIHEAGHAVAAYGERVAFTAVFVTQGEATECLDHVSPRPLREFRPGRLSDGRARRRVESLMVMLLGGLAAEEAALSEPRWDREHPDVSEALRLANTQAVSTEEAEAYVRWQWVRTKAILRAPYRWHAVEALAAALRERKRMTGRQAKQIIREAQAAELGLPPIGDLLRSPSTGPGNSPTDE